METKALGQSIQDYLKTIYTLAETSEVVSPTGVASILGVSPAAVVKMAAKLQEMNLINYNRKQGIRLTESGQKIALEVIRHHRLLELYLMEALGYSWDRVHEEAERLEHVISDEFEERIDRALDFPSHDPHGAPIPRKDGTIAADNHPPLSQLQEGQKATIRRVNDFDAKMLRYLGELGMYPGTEIQIVSREPFGGPILIRIKKKDFAIGQQLADNVFIEVK